MPTLEEIDRYHAQGFVPIRGVLTPAEAKEFYAAATEFTEKHPALSDLPIFDQFVNVWRESAAMKALTLHPRIAEVATALAGEPLRLWHEFTKLWVREGRRRGLGPDVKPFLAQHFADNRGALLGLVAAPAAPYDQRVAHFPLRPILICLTRQAWKVSRIESTCAQRSADVLATPEPEFWMPLYALDAIRPTLPVAGRCWIAPNAQIIGRVILGEDCGIWFGAVLRGDNEAITLGARTNIQEGSTLHTDMGSPLTIGEDCTIGHNAILHGCTIGAGSLIGMGAIVLNGARIGEGCLVGAGALVTEGKSFPDHSLIVGSPAKAIRTLDEAAIAGLRQSAAHYVANWKRFAGGLRPIED